MWLEAKMRFFKILNCKCLNIYVGIYIVKNSLET